MKQIFLAIMIVFSFIGCNRERNYKEVSKEYLKKELSYIEDKKNCSWYYSGNKDGYHLFSLICTKDNGSLLIYKKTYKIQVSKLQINILKTIFGKKAKTTAIKKGNVEIVW